MDNRLSRVGHRISATIQLKLSAFIVALVLVVVPLLTGFLTAAHVRDAEANLVRKAETYGQLVAHDVSSAVAFDDRETAREVFESVALDDAVSALALFGASGSLLEARGELSEPVSTLTAPRELTIVRLRDLIRVVAPVLSREGPTGALVVEISTSAVQAARQRSIALAVTCGLSAVAFGLLAAWFIARSFARRLGALARAADAVAGGNLDQQPVRDLSRDEIGRLAIAFNAMCAKLRELVETIQRSAREENVRLDALVKERTAELDRRNGEMRLVLDHVEHGLVTIDPQGRVGAERSSVLDTWFGKPQVHAKLWDWLLTKDQNRRNWFEMAWEQVERDFLPLDVALDQLPRHLDLGASSFELSYKPVMGERGLAFTLVVITDRTGRRELERAERESRELAQIVDRMQRDRTGVIQFFEEASRLVDAATRSRDPIVIAHAVHTIKGNAAMMGLEGIAQRCHEIEAAVAEGDQPEPQIALLGEEWADVEKRFAAITGQGTPRRFEVDERDYEALIHAIDGGASAAELATLARFTCYEPVERRLAQLGEHATALTERLGKGPLHVTVEGGGLRLPPGRLREFWLGCVHIVRNAVDHGLETCAARKAAGRAEPAELVLRARVDAGTFEVEIRDFGRGIDWAELRRRAERKGFHLGASATPTELLFADGVTTAERATAVSGRGCGMGAARNACERAGGQVVVTSGDDNPGAGTSVRFRFPVGAVDVLEAHRGAVDAPLSPHPLAGKVGAAGAG